MNKKDIYVGLLGVFDNSSNVVVEGVVFQQKIGDYQVFARSDGTECRVKDSIIAVVNECCAPGVTVLEMLSLPMDTSCVPPVEDKDA